MSKTQRATSASLMVELTSTGTLTVSAHIMEGEEDSVPAGIIRMLLDHANEFVAQATGRSPETIKHTRSQ